MKIYLLHKAVYKSEVNTESQCMYVIGITTRKAKGMKKRQEMLVFAQ